MLRLVHPPPKGQGSGPTRARRTSAALLLTPTERQHLGAALQNLRRAFGTWACLADAMGVPVVTLKSHGGGKRAGVGLALRTARVAGVPVESILSGSITLAGCCPTCGARPATGRLAAGGGA